MRFLALVIGFWMLAGVALAQYSGPLHTGLPSEPVRGYFQPVLIQTPEGTSLAGVIAGQFSQRLPHPFQGGLLIGCDYRLRITGIPLHPGRELFPTIILLARTYPPPGRELDFPIIVNLTLEDLELALEGRCITRVIYLEDPKTALPVQTSSDMQISHDVRSGDPVAVAATQGLPVAIVRIGGRVPPNGLLTPEFCFGSPPWTLNRTLVQEEIAQRLQTQTPLNSLSFDPALKSAGASVLEKQQEQQLANAWRRSNEYLVNGNDARKPASVEENWHINNFDTEDTIAHFDTLAGHTIVEPSNRIQIYAPRFGAIRRIEGLLLEGQVTGLVETRNQQISTQSSLAIQTSFTEQESQTRFARTQDQVSGIEGQRRSTGVDSASALGGYNNFQVVDSEGMVLLQRTFGLEGALQTRLERGAQNARAWRGSEGLRVQIDALAPMSATAIDAAAAYFQVKDERSKSSKLRLIKVASKDSAQPGEIIEFTLRFDNVGTELIGNVTILDDLTGRLEFLSGTAVASLKSGFAPQVNRNGSFTLRFEITDPLAPGDFGVIQFQCRVR